ncbi:MAG: hypothetical protein QOG80_797 [Pseudonocardiales bacterium]|nr:hypothetical protein [Pseudonocardiales bacterium]
MSPLRLARDALIGIVVLDLVALAALSVQVTSTTTRTVTPLAAVTLPTVAPISSRVATSAPALPIGGGPTAPPGVVLAAATSSPSSPAPATRPTIPARPSSTATTAAPTGRPDCPIPLKKPATAGGLQSLIDVAPAFGQFSAEAFAAASAYQPALQLLGPILARYPTLAPSLTPVLGPLLAQWQQVLNSIFTLLNPYYAPYRTQVLTAESQLAAALAPYAQRLADSALGGCVVDLEAALVSDTR